jgi:hypothetical protein
MRTVRAYLVSKDAETGADLPGVQIPVLEQAAKVPAKTAWNVGA